MKTKILALCGGIGGAKLAFGLSKILSTEKLIFLVNTGDDFIHHNLKICPDIDTVMYTLAEINDKVKGWGIQNETWNTLESLKELGADSWFQLGDKDLATHLRRTSLMNNIPYYTTIAGAKVAVDAIENLKNHTLAVKSLQSIH